MKKISIFLFLAFATNLSFSQSRYRHHQPKCALEIVSTNVASPAITDGILYTKIDAFPTPNPGAAQQGMMVYLTTTVGASQPGFYYWDNTTLTWLPVGNNATDGWKLSGNTATSSNFIGTTNNQDLIFRRNNAQAGIISFQNTHSGCILERIFLQDNTTCYLVMKQVRISPQAL